MKTNFRLLQRTHKKNGKEEKKVGVNVGIQLESHTIHWVPQFKSKSFHLFLAEELHSPSE